MIDRAGPVETACVSRLYGSVLSRAALRASSYAILSVLAMEEPVSIGELAGRLTMDRIVGSDRPRRLVQLTSLGKPKRSEARSRWDRARQLLAAEFGDEDVHDLLAARAGCWPAPNS